MSVLVEVTLSSALLQSIAEIHIVLSMLDMGGTLSIAMTTTIAVFIDMIFVVWIWPDLI